MSPWLTFWKNRKRNYAYGPDWAETAATATAPLGRLMATDDDGGVFNRNTLSPWEGNLNQNRVYLKWRGSELSVAHPITLVDGWGRGPRYQAGTFFFLRPNRGEARQRLGTAMAASTPAVEHTGELGEVRHIHPATTQSLGRQGVNAASAMADGGKGRGRGARNGPPEEKQERWGGLWRQGGVLARTN